MNTCPICGRKYREAHDLFLHRMRTNGLCRELAQILRMSEK